MASAVTVPSLSTEYVLAGPVPLRENGVVVDATDATVHLAFTATDEEPTATDWLLGDWETRKAKHFARVLIGPGGLIELLDGSYRLWVRITRPPEELVLQAGVVRIT